MAQKETAEQKLLKIIEATKKAQSAGDSAPSAVAMPQRTHGVSLKLQHVNLFLIVVVIASFLFLGYEFQRGMARLQEDVSFDVDVKASQELPVPGLPQAKSIAYYLDKIGSRNIFQPYEKKADPAGTVKGNVALEKTMAKYKIVGIAWLDVPESATVMLEDSFAHMTHFLKQGDNVDGITVKTIFTDRVVFSQANEEITIKL